MAVRFSLAGNAGEHGFQDQIKRAVLLSPAPPEECVGRVKELEHAGINNFLLTLPPKGYADVMKKWAESVMPHFDA